MSWTVYAPYVLVMAGVTYLIRMLPLTVFRKEIKSRFIRSFLAYVPYAVLTAMTIPGVLYSTYPSGMTVAQSIEPLICAAVGLVVAALLAWRKCSLLTVAVAACVGVAAMQGIFLLF